ncbi:MAG: anti-anti-sigma factor [Roseiflexus castenholzii]|uniref:STAS domain-containing protein n=1 Tax=Roseiflexus castenholzii TaxID=120962 RepID=UPI000CB21C97|nr:MAG: anti-anti-sigma factor [Roseiflexus castenholzii]
MRALLSRLIDVRHPDEDTQRRGRNVILLASGLSLLTILLATYSAFTGVLSLRVIIPIAVSLAVQTGVIILARSGRVNLAGSMMVGMAIAGTTGSALLNEDQFVIPVLFPVPLLVATATLHPAGIMVSLIGVLAGMGVVVGTLPPPESVLLRNALFVVTGLICIFTALIGALISVGHERLRRRLHAEAQRADQSAQALQRLNDELDLRVQLQTETLQQMVQELEERSAQQEQLLNEITAQREVIRKLSLPILPVGRDVLVAPLIGALDSERLHQLQTQAFQRVERARARLLILDVTGVPVIDAHVAQGLAGLIQGLRLLGAEVFIVGVRPEVAQTVVGLGIRLRDVSVFSDLGSALESATLRLVER